MQRRKHEQSDSSQMTQSSSKKRNSSPLQPFSWVPEVEIVARK
jgi:hypothetical protein